MFCKVVLKMQHQQLHQENINENVVYLFFIRIFALMKLHKTLWFVSSVYNNKFLQNLTVIAIFNACKNAQKSLESEFVSFRPKKRWNGIGNISGGNCNISICRNVISVDIQMHQIKEYDKKSRKYSKSSRAKQSTVKLGYNEQLGTG